MSFKFTIWRSIIVNWSSVDFTIWKQFNDGDCTDGWSVSRESRLKAFVDRGYDATEAAKWPVEAVRKPKVFRAA